MYRVTSPASVSSTSSLQSVLSDDSYLKTFKDVDKGFEAMLKELNALDSNRSIQEERKLQSHIQKRRDQTDHATREALTEKQMKDYEAYKSLVASLSTANKMAAASTKVAKARGDEDSYTKALADQEAKSNAAIRAAEARLGFMTRYPNVFNPPSHRNHIKAVEDNLNSAKVAQREVQIQQIKLAAAAKQSRRGSE
ncbi:hypothetical protein Daus18300_011598 [Diaporthe australafricana]|uniref:Uncharacterized protein n=1 Tax=Diaporthe australafricana TaxID=127596 RepID=A0ABR3W616_9PEZI